MGPLNLFHFSSSSQGCCILSSGMALQYTQSTVHTEYSTHRVQYTQSTVHTEYSTTLIPSKANIAVPKKIGNWRKEVNQGTEDVLGMGRLYYFYSSNLTYSSLRVNTKNGAIKPG